MSDFWRMGGYAAQVWAAYGITGATALIMAAATWFAGRAARRRLAAAEAARAEADAVDG